MKWRRGFSRSPRARAGTHCFRAASTPAATRCAITCSNCARRASTGCSRAAASSNSPLRNRCWISTSRKPVFVLVDRLAIGPELHQRLVDTIEICYREAGEVIFESASGAAAAAFQRTLSVQDLRHGVQPSRNRSCSASTRRSARARAARVSAIRSIST